MLVKLSYKIVGIIISISWLAGLAIAGEEIVFDPAYPLPNQAVTVTYNKSLLKDGDKVIMHWGYGNYSAPAADTPMQKQADGSWKATVMVPDKAFGNFDAVFHNGKGEWDNNGGENYHAVLSGAAKIKVGKPGMDYTPTATTFAIWSPDSDKVVVNVNNVDYPCERAFDFDGYTNIYGVKVPGDLKLKEYQFKINGTPVRDPYGVMVKPGTDLNIVMDVSSIQPEGGLAPLPPLAEREDAVIYEVHVRDFTVDSNSGVSAEKRGKFLGMVETGTTYKEVKTGIDHLRELGVTHVQLLPIYDFGSTQYNWGYDPVNFNVPEEQYSVTPTDYEKRIQELKTMVNEFHKNGIRVIMDVVYNHTQSTDVFKNITNKYYDGLNLSGVGNSIDTGKSSVSRFIRDSLEYWVKEFNIDGFRFDLIGVFYYDAVKNWGEYLNNKYPERKLLIYGEPWNGYAVDNKEISKLRLGNVAVAEAGHIGAFNDQFRGAIKGDNDGKGKGYMFNYNASDFTWNIRVGTRGSIRYSKGKTPLPNLWDPMFAYDPEQSVNYISAHDNFCLWDKIKYVGEDNPYGKRVASFGMGMVLTSQGIPFIHAGDEMLRTKVYNSDWKYAKNSFNAPDEYNMIRWDWKVDNADVFRYFKELIALRKAHPGFRLNSWDEVNDWVRTYTSGTVVISQIDADKNGDSWDEILVVYNPDSEYSVTLPAGAWTKVFDITGAVNTPNLTGSAMADGTAVTVLAKAKDSVPWKHTIVFMQGETKPGQDMFLRGGVDHRYAATKLGLNCTNSNYVCAIPIRHLDLRNASTKAWKTNDNHLDWYGPETGQGVGAAGTALDWTTNQWPPSFGPKKTYAVDGYGEDPENRWGSHYWKMDVEMDCSKTIDGWFELKSFITNVTDGSGWENNVSQAGSPYQSGNHFAKCGYLNVFRRGDSTPVAMEPLP